MPDAFPADSVGLVTPQCMAFDEPVTLACGRTLDRYQLMYETYGTLNADRSNAVLICHALSGNHHAAGYHNADDRKPGWWDTCIGPGKPIDTNRFFVVCPNNLGGCHGSTGPASINPETGKPWGGDFPILRVRDWVETQSRLADKLGIDRFAAIIGGSLGGMQVMRWALEHPERVAHAIVIASAMKLTAQNIAFNEIARRAIMTDPQFFDGHYLEHNTSPKTGLAIARMVGHTTYLSNDAMRDKFGRSLRTGTFERGIDAAVEFEVESYLRYQGDVFSEAFDANTYLLMTKALDYFDLAREYNDNPIEAFKKSLARFLVISFSSDWRFAPERSQEIVNALVGAGREVCYADIEANQGHDAFLLHIPRYLEVFSAYMQRIADEGFR